LTKLLNEKKTKQQRKNFIFRAGHNDIVTYTKIVIEYFGSYSACVLLCVLMLCNTTAVNNETTYLLTWYQYTNITKLNKKTLRNPQATTMLID